MGEGETPAPPEPGGPKQNRADLRPPGVICLSAVVARPAQAALRKVRAKVLNEKLPLRVKNLRLLVLKDLLDLKVFLRAAVFLEVVLLFQVFLRADFLKERLLVVFFQFEFFLNLEEAERLVEDLAQRLVRLAVVFFAQVRDLLFLLVRFHVRELVLRLVAVLRRVLLRRFLNVRRLFVRFIRVSSVCRAGTDHPHAAGGRYRPVPGAT